MTEIASPNGSLFARVAQQIQAKAEEQRVKDNMQWDPLTWSKGGQQRLEADALCLPEELMLSLVNPSITSALPLEGFRKMQAHTPVASHTPVAQTPSQQRALKKLQQRREAAAAAAGAAQQVDETAAAAELDDSWIDQLDKKTAKEKEGKEKAAAQRKKKKEAAKARRATKVEEADANKEAEEETDKEEPEEEPERGEKQDKVSKASISTKESATKTVKASSPNRVEPDSIDKVVAPQLRDDVAVDNRFAVAKKPQESCQKAEEAKAQVVKKQQQPQRAKQTEPHEQQQTPQKKTQQPQNQPLSKQSSQATKTVADTTAHTERKKHTTTVDTAATQQKQPQRQQPQQLQQPHNTAKQPQQPQQPQHNNSNNIKTKQPQQLQQPTTPDKKDLAQKPSSPMQQQQQQQQQQQKQQQQQLEKKLADSPKSQVSSPAKSKPGVSSNSSSSSSSSNQQSKQEPQQQEQQSKRGQGWGTTVRDLHTHSTTITSEFPALIPLISPTGSSSSTSPSSGPRVQKKGQAPQSEVERKAVTPKTEAPRSPESESNLSGQDKQPAASSGSSSEVIEATMKVTEEDEESKGQEVEATRAKEEEAVPVDVAAKRWADDIVDSFSPQVSEAAPPKSPSNSPKNAPFATGSPKSPQNALPATPDIRPRGMSSDAPSFSPATSANPSEFHLGGQWQGLGKQNLGDEGPSESSQITTLVFTSIPMHLNALMFRQQLDAWGLHGTYNFFYMPPARPDMPFLLGTAYVNFIDSSFASLCQGIFKQYGCEEMVSPYHIQGLENNIAYWQECFSTADQFHGPLVLTAPQPTQWAINSVMATQTAQNAKPSVVRGQFLKTKMCVFNQKKKCAMGVNCPFAHSKAELQIVPDLTKTKLCVNFFKKKCFNDNCSFAHGHHELRATDACFKTELCRMWSTEGFCKAGEACRYAHGMEELRANYGVGSGMDTTETPQTMNGTNQVFDVMAGGRPTGAGVAGAWEDKDASWPQNSTFEGGQISSSSSTTARMSGSLQMHETTNTEQLDGISDLVSEASTTTTFNVPEMPLRRQNTCPPCITELPNLPVGRDKVVLRVKGTFVEAVQVDDEGGKESLRRSWSDGDLTQLNQIWELDSDCEAGD
eukprot:TRINITY_DN15454_c1_g3_i1.p1 TRINITY_DN15454_c1_g3~~TRINITY_DN15454_c1_g3_i1.p1  ORF type:complete len:1114 (+),score=310.45 TRINITY_DN15454_c1_g3_i1:97-3438(+)